jgi:phage-related protein
MADWFDFKGVRSTSLSVVVTKHPNIPLAKERVTNETISGRSGSLTSTETTSTAPSAAVYDDVVVSIPVAAQDFASLDQIATWLRGAGDLVLGDMPDRYYKARCSNPMDLAKIFRSLETREFNAVFRGDPYRYIYPEPAAMTYLPLVNKVTNGDFTSGGTTGWSGVNAGISVVDGNLVVLATATNGAGSQSITGLTVGRKYYFAGYVEASTTSAKLAFGGTIASHPGTGAIVRLSGIKTATGTSHTLSVLDARTSGWTSISGDLMVVIDLTDTFGAGNEPTASQMDAYMSARYANSFFSGTASGGQIVNSGTADATPIITVVGSGDIDLTIGERSIHIEDLASQITIDTDSGIALDGSGNELTNMVTFDTDRWTIPPGTSAITWTGTVTSVTISRPWRCV